MLRALHIDGGKHQVELQFFPQTVKNTEAVAYVALAVMLLLILMAIALGLRKKKAKA